MFTVFGIHQIIIQYVRIEFYPLEISESEQHSYIIRIALNYYYYHNILAQNKDKYKSLKAFFFGFSKFVCVSG